MLRARKGRRSAMRKGGGTFYLKMERGGGFPRRGGGVVRTAAGRVSRGDWWVDAVHGQVNKACMENDTPTFAITLCPQT